MNTANATNEFTCENCNETYAKGWSDKEAAAEYRQFFGDDYSAGTDTATVCDDCYKLMRSTMG